NDAENPVPRDVRSWSPYEFPQNAVCPIAGYMGNFPDFAGKTFKLGIVINAIWEFFCKNLQTKEKPDCIGNPA
ncbi:hypothetical protein, partial [Thalassospira sp. UBA6510]|uniref:hypothetical protein n=1 Tax=Thalassospira sp. UBA6510 TaxID=1947676 RepID=UPI0026010BB8